MLARLPAGREVNLAPASFAFHAAAAEMGIVARRLVDPEIPAEWSLVWAERARATAIARFLESARRCSKEHGWLVSAGELSPSR